jgi:isoleucyl-tRNA synthetase
VLDVWFGSGSFWVVTANSLLLDVPLTLSDLFAGMDQEAVEGARN